MSLQHLTVFPGSTSSGDPAVTRMDGEMKQGEHGGEGTTMIALLLLTEGLQGSRHCSSPL
jgi:hypothetical protein